MSDSAFAQRRQLLPLELFEQILSAALSPLADETLHPECLFHGFRLVPRHSDFDAFKRPPRDGWIPG